MIVSAAVKLYSTILDKEVILPLHRHSDATYILSQLGHYHYDYRGLQEGFLTDKDIFLDRRAAAVHAYDCGQLVEDAETEGIEILMSEDLW